MSKKMYITDMWRNVYKEGKSNYASRYQNVLKWFGAFSMWHSIVVG
jgi:hypothetical protein